MKSRLTRALVATAAVATLGTLAGAGQARADEQGPYDQDSGQWYAGEQRRQEALGYDAYGTGRVGGFLPSYGGYPYALPRPGYYGYGAYSQPAAAPDNTARIRVIVPADARVWFGNTATRQTGQVRRFESPRLTPGQEYTYEVTARWTENSKELTQTRTIPVWPNSSATVDFTQPQ